MNPRTLSFHLGSSDTRPTIHVRDRTPNRVGHPQKEMNGFLSLERALEAITPRWHDPLHVPWHDWR